MSTHWLTWFKPRCMWTVTCKGNSQKKAASKSWELGQSCSPVHPSQLFIAGLELLLFMHVFLFLSAKLPCQHLLHISHRLSADQTGSEAPSNLTSNYVYLRAILILFWWWKSLSLSLSHTQTHTHACEQCAYYWAGIWLFSQKHAPVFGVFVSVKLKLNPHFSCSQFRKLIELFRWYQTDVKERGKRVRGRERGKLNCKRILKEC